jgi:TnpA family transposase
MFDLVDKRLSPRIAKLTEKQLYRPRPASHYKQWARAGPLLRHHAQVDVIDAQWDDLLRIGASLKQGYVSAALLIARLQAGSRQHPLSKAMLEYGKLLRTLHALRWFTDEAFRRRIGQQLNRGEALNDLRRFIFFANRGTVRYSGHEDQTTQAHCHTLVVNLCILSTTGYLQGRDRRSTRRRARRQQRSDRQPQPRPVRNDQPLRHPHVRHPRRPRAPPKTTSRP